MMNKELAENEFIAIELIDDIIFIKFKLDTITLETAKEIVKHRLEYFEGNDYPVVIDGNNVKSFNKEARTFLSSEDAVKGITISAMVSNSTFNKFLANFFIKIAVIKLKVPTKLFSDKSDAIAWIRQFKSD